MRKVLDFVKDEEGASALEYGVMIATILAVLVMVIISVGQKTNNTFQYLNTTMNF